MLAAPTLGCARVLEFTGQIAGGVAGKAAAKTPPAKTAAVARGGEFCKTLEAMGAPWRIEATDAEATQRHILNVDEHGAAHCGWKH